MNKDILDLVIEQNRLIKNIKYNFLLLESNQRILNEKIDKIFNDSSSESENESSSDNSSYSYNSENSDNESIDYSSMNISENLFNSLGLEKKQNTIIENNWTPPQKSGLDNSEPLLNKKN